MHPQTRSAVQPNTLVASITHGDSIGGGQHRAGIPEGGFDASRGPMLGSSAHGKVDLVALGIDDQTGPVFKVEPAEGVLQPGEVLDVAITFYPLDSSSRSVCHSYASQSYASRSCLSPEGWIPEDILRPIRFI